MNIYLICLLLSLSSITTAMNTDNKVSYSVTFDDPWILLQRLANHDRRYHTNFYDLAKKNDLHTHLGGKTHDHIKADNMIKNCLKANRPPLAEYKLIEYKQQMIRALTGTNPSKL